MCVPEFAIKILLPFGSGVVLTLFIILIQSFFNSAYECANGGIKIMANNDTSIPIKMFEFQTSNDQKLTCTLKYKSCNIILVNAGDMSIVVDAISENGDIYTNKIGYAESCSSHSVRVSNFVKLTHNKALKQDK